MKKKKNNRSLIIIAASLLALLSLATAARDLHAPAVFTTNKKNSPEKKKMTAAETAANMKIGSSPPRCEYKCSGCTPCEPAEVPATSSGDGFVHVQYTNYKPEGWKCKCGPSFYNP